MPEEVEIETRELQEAITELHHERAERELEEHRSSWTRFIALSTALLAVIAAISALKSGDLVNNALQAKNDSVLKQAMASDQWAYYQAKGIKKNGAEQTAALLEALHASTEATGFRKEAARYDTQQKDVMKKAEKLEKERDHSQEQSTHLMHQHHIFAFSVTLTQVAIALAAVAALTKRKAIWYLSLIAGVLGVAFFTQGFLYRAADHNAQAEHGTAGGPAAEGGSAPPETHRSPSH